MLEESFKFRVCDLNKSCSKFEASGFRSGFVKGATKIVRIYLFLFYMCISMLSSLAQCSNPDSVRFLPPPFKLSLQTSDWEPDFFDTVYLIQVKTMFKGDPSVGNVKAWGRDLFLVKSDAEEDTLLRIFLVDSLQQLKPFQIIKNLVGLWAFDNEDLNGDGVDELLVLGDINMNGNQWTGVFVWENESFAYAGTVCCDYKLSPDKKQILEEHDGSWYMDNTKTIYEWKKNRLIPVKKWCIALVNPEKPNKGWRLIGYANPSGLDDGLKEFYNRKYRSKNRRQQRLISNTGW